MCQNKILLQSKNGSVIIIAIAMFVVLFILLGSFLKSTTRRQYTTKKLNKVLLAREFATSIAALATHKMKECDLKKATGTFIEELKKPLNQMGEQTKGDITEADLRALYGSLLDDILNANDELEELKFKANWSLSKNDFKPLLPSYPREKTGIMKIFVAVNYLAPGSKEKIEEDYLYAIDLKVVANLVPVLSKFTLYMEDALSGESEERYNTLKVDSRGALKNGNEYKPWVLKHGSDVVLTSYRAYIDSQYGLVYLGSQGMSKPINLGISRAWNEPAECSEGFHLAAKGRGDGLYSVEKLADIYQMNWEIGLADDSDGDALFWFELIYRGFYDMSKVSSILKLYGVEREGMSPTLVLGNVKARTLCSRAYKGTVEGEAECGPLPFLDTKELFDDSAGVGDTSTYELYCFQPFSASYKKQKGSDLTYDEYKEKYSSTLWEVPYNRALLYMATNNIDLHPEKSGAIKDDLLAMATETTVNKTLMQQVPEPFDSIYNVSTLEKMNDLLDVDKMFVGGARIIHKINLDDSKTTLTEELKKRHLLDNNETNLNLNGWLYIKSSSPISIADKALNIISNGGIVLEQGNILLKGPITPVGGDYILQLVALDGNIDVEASGELSVGLTAASKSGGDAGQVKIIGSATSSALKIKGNLVTKHIKSVKDHMARGVKIEYNPNLAALPGNVNESNSEKPLLMIYIDEMARLVE